MVDTKIATKSDVGLSNVDNTSDVNKPVSTAQAAAISAAVNLTYLGQVATACHYPTSNAGANAACWNTRTAHYMRENVTSVQIAFANFYGETEDGPGAAMTVEAAIEYPVGTFTRVLFGGVNQQTIADGAMGALSDACSVTMPRGALFYVRAFLNCASGVSYLAAPPNLPTGAVYSTAGGQTSAVMGGVVGAGSVAVPPALIVAQTSRPSVFVFGDSIGAGAGDLADDLSLDSGIILRAIGPNFAYSSSALSGTTLAQLVSASTKRRSALGYFSHIINQRGINDVGGSSAATVIATLQSFLALPNVAGKKVFQTTLTPSSTSTDSWATTANQTGTNTAIIVGFNQQVIAGVPGLEGHFDVARVGESAPFSNKWRVDLGTPTADGLHPSNNIYREVRRAGVFNPGTLRLSYS